MTTATSRNLTEAARTMEGFAEKAFDLARATRDGLTDPNFDAGIAAEDIRERLIWLQEAISNLESARTQLDREYERRMAAIGERLEGER